MEKIVASIKGQTRGCGQCSGGLDQERQRLGSECNGFFVSWVMGRKEQESCGPRKERSKGFWKFLVLTKFSKKEVCSQARCAH